MTGALTFHEEDDAMSATTAPPEEAVGRPAGGAPAPLLAAPHRRLEHVRSG